MSALLAVAVLLAPPQDFEKDVLPILSKRCLECHQEHPVRGKRPKGGLRLDSKQSILDGGFSGDTVIPGDPEGSELIRRISVPADDEDIMPPKGDPLTKEQIETLRTWVNDGAEFGDWTGVTSNPPKPAKKDETEADKVPARVRLIRTLGEKVPPLSADKIAKAAGDDARIEPAIPDSPLLRVSFPAHQNEVDDERLAELSRIAANIVELDVSRTKITDAGLTAVAEMKRLAHLDLKDTAISDAAVHRIAKLPELRYLNLVDTRVTDAALADVAKMEKLEAVYLHGSKVSEKAVAALREKRPKLKVQDELELPVVRPLPESD